MICGYQHPGAIRSFIVGYNRSLLVSIVISEDFFENPFFPLYVLLLNISKELLGLKRNGWEDYADVLSSSPCVQPMTLAFVYAGTTIKDIAEISHGGAHFSRARVVVVQHN